jgi:hypothetical protein
MATLLARIAAARALDALLLADATGVPRPAPLRNHTAETATSSTTTAAAAGTTTRTATGTASTTASTPAPSTASTSTTAGSAATTPPTGSPTELPEEVVESLTRRLAGRHAAVYAYALVVAQLGGASRRQAAGMWAEHVRARDELERRLLAAGAEPEAAEPAYDVGLVRDPAAAVALAVRVERGLAEIAAADVGALSEQWRVAAALDLVEATQRIGRWTGSPEPLPGAPVPTPSPTTSGSASASPTGTTRSTTGAPSLSP